MIVLSLSGDVWELQGQERVLARALARVPARIPARVPGCVHQALTDAGVIRSTDLGRAETEQQWVGESDWVYRRDFDVPAAVLAHEQVELVLESVDTVAEIVLNGTALGRVASQFCRHRFDVRHLLREKSNTLEVRLRSPVKYVQEQEAALGKRPVNGGWTPYPFIRRSACSFGWDWGPRAPSLGIDAATLEAWNTARIATVRPLVVKCTVEEAIVEVHVDLARGASAGVEANKAALTVEAEIASPSGERTTAQAAVVDSGRVVLRVPNPELWWPRGAGGQPLYELRVRVHAVKSADKRERSSPLDAWRRKIGLRSVELDTSPDEHGQRFALRVNGRAIFCKGANWIPASLHPVCATREQYNQLLELACEANLNMLRVWGGGIYETEHFYERCDELGMMVWQDFMFACATYPEDASYPELIEAEARHHLARLSCHPCIVLWCGGNEDVIAWQSWGFREQLSPGQSWGERYWLQLLPRICKELDPTRPYWPDSPWSGDLQTHANDPSRGDRHTWDAKVEEYRALVPRFVSEFGHQSPSNWCTLADALGDLQDPLARELLTERQRAGGGDDAQYTQPLALRMPASRDFDEWLYHAHLLQARAMELAFVWLRSNQPRCMGALFWQWNDVWTGPTWSAVDVALRPKPVWHAVRRAAAPRMVCVIPAEPRAALDGPLVAALVNETNEPWTTRVTVLRLDLAGRELARARERVTVPPWAVDRSISIDALVGAPADARAECILVEAERERGWWMFAHDRDQTAPPARIALDITGRGTQWSVRVRAETLTRDLWIEPKAPWVRCEPNLVTLMPGEECTVEIELCESATSTAEPERPPELRVHAARGVEIARER